MYSDFGISDVMKNSKELSNASFSTPLMVRCIPNYSEKKHFMYILHHVPPFDMKVVQKQPVTHAADGSQSHAPLLRHSVLLSSGFIIFYFYYGQTKPCIDLQF